MFAYRKWLLLGYWASNSSACRLRSPFIRLGLRSHHRIGSALISDWFGFYYSRCRFERTFCAKMHQLLEYYPGIYLPQSSWSALMSMRSSLPQGFFFKSVVVSVVSVSNRSAFISFRPNCIPLPLSAWKAPGIFAAEVSLAIRPSFEMLVPTGFSERLPAAGLMVLCRSDAASLRFSQVMRLISRNDAHPFT